MRDKRMAFVTIGPSIAYVPLTRGQFALIDSADADSVGKHNWYADWSEDVRSFYVARWGSDQKKIRLHRLLLRAGPGFVTDHINGNTLDNRSANLRAATRKQNGCNQRLRRDNTSGFKGVYASRSKYSARIRVNGKFLFLGNYDTAEAAHEARKNAAAIHHGEFARTA